MRPEDIIGGLTPAQDHDPDQELRGRVVRYAFRVERTTEAGNVVAEGHTPPLATGDEVSASAEKSVGDEHGRFLWRAQTPGDREIPQWHTGAAPAVTTEASRDLRAGIPIDQSRTRAVAQLLTTDAAQKRVRVRPVGDVAFAPDGKFREIDAALPGVLAALPKGYPGVVLVTTNVTKQEELFVPAGGGPLIAVDHAGDPSLATLVSDLTDEDELDPDRRARLHTMMRVVRVGKAIGLAQNNALAWQLKAASRDGFSGGGIVIDRPGASLLPPPAPTPPPPATRGDDAASQYGAVTNLANYTPPPAHEGQVGGVTQLGGTRTRAPAPATTPGSQTAPATTTPPSITRPGPSSAAVVAAMTARLSGLIDVGDHDDQHRLGTTLDGEPINSGHLPVGFLVRGGRGDGPIDIDIGTPYTNPPSWPFRTKVYIRWDPDVEHGWVGGKRRGKWRAEGEGPFYMPDPPRKPPPPPRRPPPPPPPGIRIGRDYPVTPTPPKPDTRPAWLIALELRLGVRAGSLGFSGTLALTPEQYEAALAAGLIDEQGNVVGALPIQKQDTHDKAGAYPTAVQKVRFAGGLVFRANPTADGAPNATGEDGPIDGGVTAAVLVQLGQAPDVAQLLPYGAGSGTIDGFDSTILPSGEAVAAGGLVVAPAGTTVKKIKEGRSDCSGRKAYITFPPCHARQAFGTPAPDGTITDGFETQAEVGGATQTTTHRDSDGALGADLSFGADGSVLARNAGGDAVLSAADGLLAAAEVTSTPAAAPPGTGGFFTEAALPYHIDDAGNVTALGGSTGGGGMVAFPSGESEDGPAGGEQFDRIEWGPFGRPYVSGNFLFSGTPDFTWAEEDQNGRNGSYVSVPFSGEDGDIEYRFKGAGMPVDADGLTTGVSMTHKLTKADFTGDDPIITLSVIDPDDGSTLASATRTPSTNDTDYHTLTIPPEDLVGLVAGDMLEIVVSAAHGSPAGGGSTATFKFSALGVR